MGSTVWSGTITVADVSIAVKLQVAAKTESIGLHQLHRADQSRVSQVLYCQAEHVAINRNEVGLGYEYKPGQYVMVEDSDVKAIAPPSAKEISVEQFVKFGDIDPTLFLDSYFVRPADEAAELAYTALYAALKDSKRAGIGKISMYRRESIALIRAGVKGIVLQTLFYSYEMRRTDEFRTNLQLVKDADAGSIESLKMRRHVRRMRVPTPDFSNFGDGYRDAILAVVSTKMDGNPVETLVTTEGHASASAGPS